MVKRRHSGGAGAKPGRSASRVPHAAFIDVLSKRGPPLVVVLAGDDGWLRDRALERLREAATQDGKLDIGEYDGADRDLVLASALDEARTFPFLAPRRLVLIRRADRFANAGADSDAIALEAYLSAPADWSCLCLCVNSLDARRVFAKAALAAGAVVDCSSPPPARVESWLGETLKHEHGKRLEPAAARLLLDLLGADLAPLAQALEKLSLLVGKEPLVRITDVEALVGRDRGTLPWDLVDALVNGELKPALEALHLVWRDGLEGRKGARQTDSMGISFQLLSLLGRGLTDTIRARLVLDHGPRGAPEAAAAFDRLAPWQQDRAKRRARNQSLPALRVAWEQLLEAEGRLKGGDVAASAQDVMFDLVLALSRCLGSRREQRRRQPARMA